MNMLTQVDSEGHSTTLMEGIIDHKRDIAAIPMEDKHVTDRRGNKKLRKTTKGWMFLVRWRDSSETWVKLADLKESHPVELAEYATARGMSGEPAFAWWVPYTLRKRDVIISAVKSRLRKATHKYGVEIRTQ